MHLQKPFEAGQTEAGAFLTGGPTGEETYEPGGTNIKTFRQMANNNQRSIHLRYSKNDYTIEFTDLPRQNTVVDSQDSPKMQTLITCFKISSSISAVETQNLKIPGYYNRLFLVDKKDGGSRPVLDLSKLNNFVANEKFKMEGLFFLKSLLKRGYYMAKLDLTEAY